MRKALTLVVFLSALSWSAPGAAEKNLPNPGVQKADAGRLDDTPGAKSPAGAKRENDDQARAAIHWPSRTQADLQSVIDEAPDGATIRIAPGFHLIQQPIFVRGRRLRIEGARWTRTELPPLTRLVGRAPQRVVDERGEITLPAADVSGLLNVIGGEVVVSNLRLSGFDAGVVLRDDERGAPGKLTADRLFIDGTGRGVLALSSGTLNVTHTTVVKTQWHGISVGPGPLTPMVPPKVFVFDTKAIDPEGAGMYFQYATVGIQGCTVIGAKQGGILASNVYSDFSVQDCSLLGNQEAGILIENMIPWSEPAIVINKVDIEDTSVLPGLPEGRFGDGIMVMTDDPQRPAEVLIARTHIAGSARAAVSSFGSSLSLWNNELFCQAFDLDGEHGVGAATALAYSFNDMGSNKCGCWNDYPRACVAASSQLQPPKPIGGNQ